MAEVLEFNDMFYTNFEPKMKNRFIMEIDGIPSYLIKTINGSSIQFEVVTLDTLTLRENSKEKVSGKMLKLHCMTQLYQVVHNL